MELAQANARLLMEVYLAEKLPLPPTLRRALRRKPRPVTLSLPVSFPAQASVACRRRSIATLRRVFAIWDSSTYAPARVAMKYGSIDAPGGSRCCPVIPVTSPRAPCERAIMQAGLSVDDFLR